MRAVSPKRAKQNRAYSRLRAAFLEGHPDCELCGRPAGEVHHKRGRVGALLTNADHWAALCRTCHAFGEAS